MIALDAALRRLTVCQLTQNRAEMASRSGRLRPLRERCSHQPADLRRRARTSRAERCRPNAGVAASAWAPRRAKRSDVRLLCARMRIKLVSPKTEN